MTTQEFLGMKLWCMTRMALEPENLQAKTSDDITKSMHETFFTRFLKANSYKCLNYKKITRNLHHHIRHKILRVTPLGSQFKHPHAH